MFSDNIFSLFGLFLTFSKIYFLFLFIYEHVCIYVSLYACITCGVSVPLCVCITCASDLRAQERMPDLLELALQLLAMSCPHGCWEPNLGPLEEQLVFK